jgi:hypothetical protein
VIGDPLISTPMLPSLKKYRVRGPDAVRLQVTLPRFRSGNKISSNAIHNDLITNTLGTGLGVLFYRSSLTGIILGK